MKKQIYLPYALLAAIAVIIVGLILHFAGTSFEKWALWVEMLPYLVLIIIGAFAYSKANNHYVTFGEVFVSGFKITVIVSVIMAIWAVVSVMIFPDIRGKILEGIQKGMVERGTDPEQIERDMVSANKYFEIYGAGMFLFTYLLWGSLGSLAAAAIVKKKGEAPADTAVQ